LGSNSQNNCHNLDYKAADRAGMRGAGLLQSARLLCIHFAQVT